MNRRLSVRITLSRTDRYQTEGLCGTWNGNYEDDYTGRDGIVYWEYWESTIFARTWNVSENDSLFLNRTRTEKLSQSFMYCSCMEDTLDSLSPNVDCSWEESLPVCPPLNWGKESCAERKKRSTDIDDDKLIIDVSPEILAHIQKPEVSLDWKNGWTEASATLTCNLYFNESVLFEACSSLSNVNATAAIYICIHNIQISGTDDYSADAFEMFKSQCINEVRINNTLWTETGEDGITIGEMITRNSCPFDCKYNKTKHGDCVNSKCSCYSGYTGDDCRVNMEAPPHIVTEATDDIKCDTSTRSCTITSVYGEYFYDSENLKCRLEEAELISNQFVQNGTTIISSGRLENFGEVKCPINANGRRKRSVDSSTSPTYYLVSVTNNGVNYSEPVPVIIYDSSCSTCIIADSVISCTLRADICVVNGVCYPLTSSQCPSQSTSESVSADRKLWIIGVVISVLLLLIIFLVVLKMCRPSKPIAPLQNSECLSECGLALYDTTTKGPDYHA